MNIHHCVFKMASGFVKAELSTCRHGRPQVTCWLLYKSVLLLFFGLILWKWMNGVDSLGSNQECRMGYKPSHSRVFQCLASIRKLGNRKSSQGLHSFKPSKGTNLFILIILTVDIEMNPGPRFQCGLCKKYLRHWIDSLNVRNAKNASMLHAQTLVRTNSQELNLVTELGIVQTVKLTVVFAVVLS